MKESILNGESKNIVSDNISKLKEIFPEIVAEDKIDFDELKLILGEEIDDSKEKYSFTWPGKIQAIRESQKQSTGTLRPCKEESKNWDTTKNLYIEGDNLEVLKLLQKGYYNKINAIYIDPPYNTGKDFIYSDNYHDNLKNYLKISGQVSDSGDYTHTPNGIKLTTNAETHGRYHSNWLNMMYPRLKLARNLLTDDGAIFISIDENEFYNLKKLCDLIFGEENFIENFIWIKNSTKNLSKTTSTNHEYILAYAKNIDIISEKSIFRVLKPGLKEVKNILETANKNTWSIEKTENELNNFYKKNPKLKGISSYKRVDYVDVNGEEMLNVFTLSDLSAPKSSGKSDTYDIIHPITQKVCKTPSRGWLFKKIKMMECINNNLIYFYDDETHVPRFKRYLDTVSTDVIKSTFEDFTDGKKELMKLFDGNTYFDNAKPTSVIKKFIELFDNSIILDFFSGSATLAQSIFDLNNGNKFILVQIPELTDEKSEAFKAGYKTICELGKERIRRSGDKIVEESGNNDLDIGFKVFKLDSSNLKKWDPDYNNVQQSLTIDNIKEDRTNEDLVYEIMLKYGIDLTYPIEKHNNIYSIGFGALIICLDNNITKEITDEILKLTNNSSTSRVVFKDSGFKSDADKTNIKEILKTNNIDEFITL